MALTLTRNASLYRFPFENLNSLRTRTLLVLFTADSPTSRHLRARVFVEEMKSTGLTCFALKSTTPFKAVLASPSTNTRNSVGGMCRSLFFLTHIGMDNVHENRKRRSPTQWALENHLCFRVPAEGPTPASQAGVGGSLLTPQLLASPTSVEHPHQVPATRQINRSEMELFSSVRAPLFPGVILHPENIGQRLETRTVTSRGLRPALSR